VNYPTLSDRASCESSQPLRETSVLRSAVCRKSSRWGWPVHLAFCDSNPQVSNSQHTDSPNSIVLLPSRLAALVRNCANPNSTGTPSSAFLSRVLYPCLPIDIHQNSCAKHYKNLVAFIPQLAQGDFPPIKLKIYKI
jgi:hypothetical protein